MTDPNSLAASATWIPKRIPILLGLACYAGCASDPPAARTELQTLWCYNVPVESLFEGLSDEARDRLNRENTREAGIHCAAERPSGAEGDALLPVIVDHAARVLDVEGGLDVSSDSVIVKIAGLEPGEWVEHKRVYNLSSEPWTG